MYDALIIGAGPAGSTAARLLARAGWSVGLVEKSSFPRRKVCGEFISATSLPLLYDRGVRDGFLGQAGPEVRCVGLFARDVAMTSAMPSASRSVAGWGRALGRDRLDLMLAEAAAKAGAEIWQPWKMIALDRQSDRFACTLSQGDRQQQIRALIVIAANGSWEKNPWLSMRPHSHRPSDLLAFKAHFSGSALPQDLMPLLVFPGGYGGMVHTDGGRVSLSCCIRRDALEACRKNYPGLAAGEAVIQHIVNTSDGVREALRPAQLDGAWLSAGPIRPGIRPRYRDGIFFVGNSAGEAHPIIAEGISMAMQSAWLLSQRLIEGRGNLAEAGRLYAKDWHKAFATRIRAAAAFAHLAMWPSAARALPIVKRFPEILTWGARLSGKTTQLVP
ncbi:MAG TPA: NAD(P)/FAD-dependent oxidoreductase [Micropepsaceae bacterium]|nr:NAD(P)/FAD-dependent oxidoreductase [Micropepsaceae bacterium]